MFAIIATKYDTQRQTNSYKYLIVLQTHAQEYGESPLVLPASSFSWALRSSELSLYMNQFWRFSPEAAASKCNLRGERRTGRPRMSTSNNL